MTISYRLYDKNLKCNAMIDFNVESWKRLEEAEFWKLHFGKEGGQPGLEFVWEETGNLKDHDKRMELVVLKPIGSYDCLIDTFDRAFPQNNYPKILAIADLYNSRYMELTDFDVCSVTKGHTYRKIKEAVWEKVTGTKKPFKLDQNEARQRWREFLMHDYLVSTNKPRCYKAERFFYEQTYRDLVGVLPGEEECHGYGYINGRNVFIYNDPALFFDVDLDAKDFSSEKAEEAIEKQFMDLVKGLCPNHPGDIAIYERLLEMKYRMIQKILA